MPRYLVGIDLGTTNCALAFVDLAKKARGGRPDAAGGRRSTTERCGCAGWAAVRGRPPRARGGRPGRAGGRTRRAGGARRWLSMAGRSVGAGGVGGGRILLSGRELGGLAVSS